MTTLSPDEQPLTPDEAADQVVGLRRDITALRVDLASLNRHMSALVKAQVRDEVAEVSIPREELLAKMRLSGVRVAVALVLVLVLAAAAVVTNRVTLQQAQRDAANDLRTLVQTCRTTAPTISPADLAFCERRIPGFTQARARIAKTAETARRAEERLVRLEREVANLKE
jgi:hypothetical protein